MNQSGIRQATAQVVTAYVGSANARLFGELDAGGRGIPDFISSVGEAFSGLASAAPVVPEVLPRPAPAVPISKSVQEDYIVCLEDGARVTCSSGISALGSICPPLNTASGGACRATTR